MLDAVLSKTRPVCIRTNTVSSAIPEKPKVAWRILAVGDTGKQFFGYPTSATNASHLSTGSSSAGSAEADERKIGDTPRGRPEGAWP